ncbi:MAG: hypothetical protein IKB98_02075 [Clostridia bacterium]|nr:hypothetical protein [Clostridia bacterium]
MRIDKARQELIDIDNFCKKACDGCTANDWYCPSECEMLTKARKLDFERIVRCYAYHDGDLCKVFRYIKQTKINRKKGGY